MQRWVGGAVPALRQGNRSADLTVCVYVCIYTYLKKKGTHIYIKIKNYSLFAAV